ncbi:hypothetical protein LC605_20785 [Nostoc sp. CHAB 5836]|uniref:hypothetical protein n=1 Tax=Nostoc sp. CHAB 5836 TaxID=2780404 RepID=UPI001E621CEF|nr:hypothetical protein [Nostoc sp. CHAB 5836]MCC5617478.1 hypothetical protein [Nostoc sp. CHAB 5836]
MNNTGLKAADGRIQQRIVVRHTAGMNADMSIDAREPLTPKKQRTKGVKTSRSIAMGQYTKETSTFVEYRVVFYRYLPNQVFRRHTKTGLEVPILGKIDGEWFPCEGIMLTNNEINQLKAFEGAAGLDVDSAIKRKRPLNSRKGTANNGGKYTYRCRQDNDPVANKKRHNQARKDASKVRSLIAGVQMANVKRK